MGLRSFLKNKVKSAIGRTDPAPATSAPAAPSAQDIQAAFANLPKEPDADGYTAVAPSNLLKDGEGNTFKVGEVPVAVFRVEGKLFVIDDECTHENGPLGEGEVDGFVVTCPYHDWRFDVRSGECLSHDNRHVGCFAVKEADGYIWVGPRTRELAEGRGGDHDDGMITVKRPADS